MEKRSAGSLALRMDSWRYLHPRWLFTHCGAPPAAQTTRRKSSSGTAHPGWGPALLFDPKVRATAVPAQLRRCAVELATKFHRLPRLLEEGSATSFTPGRGRGRRPLYGAGRGSVGPGSTACNSLISTACATRFAPASVTGRGWPLPRKASTWCTRGTQWMTLARRAAVSNRCATCSILAAFSSFKDLCARGRPGTGYGLHQHDLIPEQGRLLHFDRAGRRTDLTAGLPLVCVTLHGRLLRARHCGLRL